MINVFSPSQGMSLHKQTPQVPSPIISLKSNIPTSPNYYKTWLFGSTWGYEPCFFFSALTLPEAWANMSGSQAISREFFLILLHVVCSKVLNKGELPSRSVSIKMMSSAMAQLVLHKHQLELTISTLKLYMFYRVGSRRFYMHLWLSTQFYFILTKIMVHTWLFEHFM